MSKNPGKNETDIKSQAGVVDSNEPKFDSGSSIWLQKTSHYDRTGSHGIVAKISDDYEHNRF